MPRKRTGPCCTEGCGNPDGWGADQLCHSCRHRTARYGDPFGSPEPRPPKDRRCDVDGCNEPHEAKGKCRLHYVRERKGYDVPPDVADGRRMIERACIYDGCTEPAATKRGLCTLHYNRWCIDKDDLGPVGPRVKGEKIRRSPLVRIYANTDIPATLGPCWMFRSPDPTTGYGNVFVGSKRDGTAGTKGAHVVVSEHHHGPVPKGWHVDHLCYNRACVYIGHLEQVPAAENARRAVSKRQAENRQGRN